MFRTEFDKLVHLVGFITRMNINVSWYSFCKSLEPQEKSKLARKFISMQKNGPSHQQPVRPLDSAHVTEQ